MASGEAEGGGWAQLALKAVLAAAAVVFVLAVVVPKNSTEYQVRGIKVVSEIPIERFERMDYLAMSNATATPAELTCKFELSAISQPDPRGYVVTVGEGDTGVYLKDKGASIKGATEEELLRACHVFACLRDGVECPDFDEAEAYINGSGSMSLILDERIDAAGGRGYAELMGALSFLQGVRADANRDGTIDQREIDANEFFIYPWFMVNGSCQQQPLNNLIQNWTRRNITADCAKITPAIMVVASNTSAIRVEDGKIVVAGNGDGAHTGAIVLRDIIAPAWIRRLYGFN